MASSLNESMFWPIEDALAKHFDSVFIDNYSSDNVIIKCMLSGPKDTWYNFPIEEDVFYASNPYDVVNSIWEYITKYVL